MIENWPELEALDLNLSGKLSTASLISLGKHCPRLKDCRITGEYDLNVWRNIPRPIFPQLESLHLSNLVDKEGESK